MAEKYPGREEEIEKYDENSENDLTEEGEEIGPVWRKIKLQLLAQQIQEQLKFYIEIATKRQMIKSIRLNFNNTEVADDDYIFSSVLKGIKYFLISISNL